MKKIYLLLAILCVTNTYATEYVPFVNENAEWQILHTTYPFEFQMAKTITHQIYTLHGDTIIENQTYKKICLKTNVDGQVNYVYFGAVREQDKKIYYVGNGYFTTPTRYNVSPARMKAMSGCLSSYSNNSEEVILYDFNAKPGDVVSWGYTNRQIISEDSVLVGNSYRRRLHLSDGDKVVEGIGSIIHGTLSSVSPMPMCSDYYDNWEFETFSSNGMIVYKSTKNVPKGYQAVYSHRTAYFNAGNNITETLKIDSCAFFNDSIMYPSRTVQLIGDDCYDPYGGGWAGKKVVINNGWNYFFNDDNDTIKIKTDAVLNENWTLFQRADIKISATVTKWDTAMVLGVADSVKTITLHVFDAAMNPISHELENATITISKLYGLVKALNFTYFPALKYNCSYFTTKKLDLVGITNPELGVQKLKWFDVFDFQVGDEFHYVESENYLMSGGSSLEKKYIIRILTRENFTDSIRYTQDVRTLRRYKPNAHSDFIITLEHSQNTNLIQINSEFEQKPGIPVFNRDSTRFQISPVLNITTEPDFFVLNSGCWQKIFLTDDACNSVSYAKGRGLVMSISGCHEEQNYARKEQVYYKKGSVTWGTPLILTANEELNAGVAVTVYPNPVADRIFVDLNNVKHSTFELFDAQGRLILQQELSVQKNQVGVQQLGKGMYLYRLSADGRQVKAGRIIKE